MLLSLVLNKKKICFFITLICNFLLFAKNVPEWYEHREVIYPDGFYITAVGEGDSKLEAEISALSGISMYFNIQTEVTNELERTMKEVDGSSYSFNKKTEMDERAKVSSQSEFFGVQFDECFFVDGKFTTIAYIERDSVFDVYYQRIKSATSKMQSLLLTAEDFNNPLSGLEAAEEAVPLADYVSELMKMARIVKKCDESFFMEENALVQRAYNSLEICRQNLTFHLIIKNDYEDMIYTTLSSLMESAGYSVSKYDGICSIPVNVSIEKTESSSAVFLYCGLNVKISDGTGRDFFSYSRTFPKKGGKTEQQAYNRAFQVMQEELKKSFIQEFSERLIR